MTEKKSFYNYLRFIYNVGVRSEYPRYLKGKIRISNQLATLNFVLCLIFFLFSWNYDLIFTACIFLIACSLYFTLFLHHKAYHSLARFLLSVSPCLGVTFYHVLITPSGDPGLIPLQVASLALAIIPWIVIDSREPKLLYTSASIPLILTFCFRPLNSLIDLNKQEHPFQQEVLAHFTLVASILVVIICLQALVRKSRSIEKKMVEAKESTVESLNKLKESQAMLIQKEKLASIGIRTRISHR